MSGAGRPEAVIRKGETADGAEGAVGGGEGTALKTTRGETKQESEGAIDVNQSRYISAED